MKIKILFLLTFVLLQVHSLQAQSTYPSVSPTVTYTDDEGVEQESSTDISGQAPLKVVFRANPEDMDGWQPTYEWHFCREGESQEFMVRYEEETEYTFTESGTTRVVLLVKFPQGEQLDSTVIRISISESKLVFPNAFSPNDDGINDVYKAREYQSLVEFHAYIFNRWGQKIFEWTNPADGWDGKHNGSPVKDGTYFLLCKARGADGRHYNIRKDVNILRGYIEGNTIEN